MPDHRLTSTLMWVYALFYSLYFTGQAAIIASGKGGEMPAMPSIFGWGYFILFFCILLVLEIGTEYISEKMKGDYV